MTTNGRMQMADAFKHLNPGQKLAEGLTSGFSRIGMKGKVWNLVHQGERHLFIQDDGHPLPYLDVVIVGANQHTSKLYYPVGSYNEDATGAPVCASINGERPDPGVAIPQSKSCHDCKHNQWLPNRGGKQCQDHRRVAVLPLPYMKTKPTLPAAIKTAVFFKVPPASLKSFKAYSDMLENDDMHFASVITRITFDPTKQFQINFDVFKRLENDDAKTILPLLDAPQTRSLIGSMAEIRQVEGNPPDLPAPPLETGLAGLFGVQADRPADNTNLPAKRGPGRPKKLVEQPKAEEAAASTAATEAATEEATEATDEQQETSWEEPKDADLDGMMKDVLGGMMQPPK